MEEMKRVEKGWGHELWIHNDSWYCGKLMHFNAGKRCSVHFHKLKHETFFLSTGCIKVRYCSVDDALMASWSQKTRDVRMSSLPFKTITLMPGQKLELPPWTIHQMLAEEDSDMFEFSTEHFDSDSYRLEKGD